MVRDVLEAFVLACSAAGTWWAYRNVRESDKDYDTVVLSGQNGLLLLTAQSVRAQLRAWGLVSVLLLVIILTWMVPEWPWLQAVRRASFLGMLLVTVVGSMRAERQRRDLMTHALEEERARIEQRRRVTDR